MHHSIRKFGFVGFIASVLMLLTFAWLPTRSAGTATPSTPILLIVNHAAPYQFGAYLGEVLRAEGLNSFDVVDISSLTALTLTQHDVAILAYTSLTSGQASMLTNYVSNGGRMIAMRPDSQIKSVFGLGSSAGVLTDGYLKINSSATISGTAPGQGLNTSTLQIHGAADEYNTAGTVTIAQLYSDATTDAHFPAVVMPSSGQTAAFTYDLAQNIIYTRQGNPANANIDVDNDGVTRTVDLFQTVGGGAPWVDRDKIQIPQADEQQRLFARLVQQLMADKHPLPQLWYFPGNAKTMLILTGDAHANPIDYYQREIDSLNSHGGKITLFMSIGTAPDQTTLNTWRDEGHDFGVHPYAYRPDAYLPYSSTNLSEGYTASDTWWSATYNTAKSPTVRNHQVAWQGWTDAADIAATHGIALDTDFYTWGNWLQKADGTWPHGYINGSGQPMLFVREEDGSFVPNYQLGTELIDEQLLCISSSECLDATQALAVSQQLINSSLAGDYAALVAQFHIDYYAESQVWAEATMDYARSQNVPMWNANQWLTFVETRHDATYGNFAWDTGTGVLSFNLVAATTPGITLTTMLPGMYDGRGLQSVAVNGISTTFSIQAINGVNMAFVSTAAGNHSFSASYQTGTVFPTPTFTPTPTGTITPTVTPTVTVTATPVPTSTTALSNNTLTQTTYIDFGQSCAVLTDTHVSDVGDGAVVLAGAFADDFGGSALNASRWMSGTWSGGSTYYSATVSGSVVTLPDDGWIRSTGTYTHGVMEAIAQFSNGPQQHLGFASADFAGDRFLLFSTDGFTTTLFARANNSASEQRFDLGAVPGGMHRYRIEWSASSDLTDTDTVQFYVDSALRASMVISSTGARDFYLYMSNDGASSMPLAVDQAQVTPPYLTKGTYTSCVYDAGASNTWQKISWEAALTTTNSLTVQVRTSPNNSTWSAWTPALSSGSAISPMQRYAQYQLALSTGDTQTTPQVNWVALGFSSVADLAIAKTASPSPVMAGSDLTYTLVVTNYGPADASGLTIIDTLPNGVTFLTATSSAGSCGPFGGLITCTLSTLPANGQFTATIRVSVSAQAAGPLVNSAQVTAADTTDRDSSNNIATVTVPVNDTLSVTRSGSGSGTVSSTPGGINCGPTCSANFGYNTVVTLTALADTGSTFSGWSGSGCSAAGSCIVTMSTAKSVTATFALNTYTLTVATAGKGSGVVTPTVGTHTYLYNTVVPLTATANTGSSFTGWSGGASGLLNSTTVTMTANKTVTATFTQDQYTLTANVVGNGSVAKSPDPGPYTYGTVVTLTATPDAGWSFGAWSGGAFGSTSPVTVTMTANKTVTATFTQDHYTLTVNKVGNGSVAKSPDQGTYIYGTVVTLTATPDAGWSFSMWSGGAFGSTNPVTVTMTANKTVTATFTQGQYTLTVNLVGSGKVAKSPDQATFASGTVVTLTATPATGWSFSAWSGDASGSTNPVTVTMTANKTVTATFVSHIYLPLITSGTGAMSQSGMERTLVTNDSAQDKPFATSNELALEGQIP